MEDLFTLESVDYTTMAMESLVETLEIYNEIELQDMISESNWLLECLDCGYIVPYTENVVVMEKLGDGNIKDTIKEKFDRLIEMLVIWWEKFTNRLLADVAKRANAYSKWAINNGELLADRAKKVSGGVDMAPYNKIDPTNSVTSAVNAIKLGITAMNSKKYDDYSYMDKIVSPDLKDDAMLVDYILDYFKFGAKDTLPQNIRKNNYSGNALSALVKNTIVPYIGDYERFGVLSGRQLRQAMDANKLKQLAKKVGTKYDLDVRVITKESYLGVEERFVAESFLTTMINYQSVLEKAVEDSTENKKDVSKEEKQKQKEAANNLKTVDTPDKDGQSDDGKKDGDKSSGENEDTASTKSNNEALSYFKTLERVCKLIATSCATALDERFTVYVNVLLTIAKDTDVPLPKSNEYINTKTGDDKPKESTDKSEDNNSSDQSGNQPETKHKLKNLFKRKPQNNK